MRYSISNEKITPPGSTGINLITTSATPVGKYNIIITGYSENNSTIKDSTVVLLEVLPQNPDFHLSTQQNQVNLSINRTTKLEFESYSLFGFADEVSFSISGLPSMISASINPTQLKPPGNITLLLTPRPGTELGIYNIELVGTAKNAGTKRTAVVQVDVQQEEPKFNITIKPSLRVTINATESGKFELIITPIAGFSDMVNITLIDLPKSLKLEKKFKPTKINKRTSIIFEITNTTQTGTYLMNIEVTGGNHSEKREIQLIVYPKKEEDNNPANYYATISVILVCIIIIIILMKFLLAAKRSTKLDVKKQRKVVKKKKSK